MRELLVCFTAFMFFTSPTFADEAYDAYQRGDYKAAFRLFNNRAHSGEVFAQVWLGTMYNEGEGVSKDFTQAAYWYGKAAEQGDAKSQAYLGHMYREGEGVSKDFAQAAYWYGKAAEQGDATAQTWLGYMYEEGEGVSKDFTQAAYWYGKAAEQGDATAINRIASLEKDYQTRSPSQDTRNQINDIKPVYFGNYHGIVIGNNDYRYMPKLNTAVSDAKAVASILEKKYGFRITLLLNVSRMDILLALEKMRRELGTSDNLLIYYAGHGSIDKQAERGYWLPVNAGRQSKANWVANEDITSELKAIRAKHVLIVADSCYSGTLTRDTNSNSMRSGTLEEWVRRMANQRSRTVLASGGLEPVLDSGGGSHSVFAKAFLKTLRENQKAADMDSLFGSIRKRVVTNANQTPIYSTIRRADHDDGDFIFVPH